jgi:hypothetical protein
MAQTLIGKLKGELDRASTMLGILEDGFRSPVNQAAVAAIWGAAGDGWIVRVAVREEGEHGAFYRGRITRPSSARGTRGGWEVLADDGELVHGVNASTFVSVLLEQDKR